MQNKNTLNWRFDVNTFRLIGRELITDRITAVYELVKNSYDANATEVNVIFKNISPDSKGKSEIIISDNGHGMSYEDIRDKWMVVGTASKRNSVYSEEPFNRRYVGEKGIGRFAVDKLGSRVTIETFQKKSTQKLLVEINWDEYEELAKSPQLTLFTDIDNTYYFEEKDRHDHGTILRISNIADYWTDIDIKRLERELEKIVSPFYPVFPPFSIFIQSNEFEEYENKKIEAETIKYSSHHFSISYDHNSETQETLFFNKNTSKIEKKIIPYLSFGPIVFELFYFNEKAKQKYNRIYKDKDYRIDGVKIYRDGLITTPFAEYESSQNKKRDILGIDKRLWSGFLDKIGSREIIGILDITKENNPNIIDATNRQDFVDNKPYRELKDFIISQLKALGELKKYEREQSKQKIDEDLKKANLEVKQFSSVLKDLETQNPKLKETLKPLKQQAQNIDKSIKKGIEQQNKERKEHLRKENIYLSLMSLQDYAIHISHAIRTSLGKVKRMAEFFKERFPNPELEDYFKDYSNAIFEEMTNLNRIIDFMLSYAGSNMNMEEINIKNLIENLFLKAYLPVFEAEDITPNVEVRDNFILSTNRKFFEDIFENLISNSLKALRNEEDKIIKCSGFIEDDHFVIYYSDNGEGISPGEEDRIFEMYYTTTADLGGAGIGLYIVKTRVESLKGTIEVIKSEFYPKGISFKITFPFKK